MREWIEAIIGGIIFVLFVGWFAVFCAEENEQMTQHEQALHTSIFYKW